jgi:hypothetical protein
LTTKQFFYFFPLSPTNLQRESCILLINGIAFVDPAFVSEVLSSLQEDDTNSIALEVDLIKRLGYFI